MTTASFTTSTLVVTKRAVLKFVRTPQLVVLGAVQGAMFLLIFRYVIGGAIASGGLKYVDFLVPGFITTGVLFSGAGAAAGVAEDVEQGFFDRLRSLPISRLSVPMGRALADTAAVAYGLVVTVAIGFLVGVERGWRSRDVAEGGRTAGLRTYALTGLLGGVSALLAKILGGWALAAGRARHLLARHGRLRNRISGGMLIGAGAVLAAARHR